MTRKVTDQHFIDTWRELQSTAQVSQALGLTYRATQGRRRSIEDAYGIELKSTTKMWVMKEQEFVNMELDDARVLVGSDIHVWPGVETTAMRAFVLACEYMQPDVVVLNGDVFDGTTISRFTPSEWNKKPSPAEELRACIEWVAKVVLAARRGNRKVRLVWTMGNHDNRYIRQLCEAASGYLGVKGMDIRDHFPDWEFCYRFTINEGTTGHTDIVHNWAGGVHAAYNNVLKSGVNYVTGHTHRNQSIPMRDRTGVRYGVETGTGLDIDGPQSYYVSGRPVNWHPGFPLLTFWKGQLLRPEHVDVVGDGLFSFRGQVVDADLFSQAPRLH